MFYSLVPYVGRGTDLDPFRPQVDGDNLALDLRADTTAAGGQALLETPGRPPATATLLGDSPDAALTVDQRLRIGAMFGTVVAAPTLRELLPELLLGHLRRPVAIERSGGRRLRRILLGELRWEQEIPGGPGTLASESFNKPDAATLGPDLTWVETAGDWAVVNNAAQGAASNVTNVAVMDATLATGDHRATATIAANNGSPGPLARATADGLNYYYGRIQFDGTWQFYKTVGGTTTLLGSLLEAVPALPFDIEVRAQGSAVTLLLGSTAKVGPITDTSVAATNLRAGIRVFGANGRIDSFVAADIPPPGGIYTPPAPTIDTTSAPLHRSHRRVSRLEVLDDGVAQGGLPVLGGTVTLDSSSSVRRRGRIRLTGRPDLIPQDVGSLLSPYGNEVRVFVGHPGRQWAAGTLRIEEAHAIDDGGRAIELECFDRSDTIARARSVKPVSLAAGTLYTDGITKLARLCLPGVPVSLSPSSRKLTQRMIWEAGEDLWREGIERLATALGHEAFFDGMGILTTREPPQLTEANVVHDFTDRRPSGLLEVRRAFVADPGYNVFVVTGEAARTRKPVTAIVRDNDPTSPTYWRGKYGSRPRFYRSEFITTKQQAEAAGLAMLARELGGTEQLRVTHWSVAYFEGSDVIHVDRGAAKIDELASIQSTVIDLSPDGRVTTTTRRRRTVVPEAA